MNRLIKALAKGEYSGVLSPLSRKRGLIHVYGPDTLPFLQGISSQKMHTKDQSYYTGSTCDYAAFLSPKGRVLHDSLLYHRVNTKSVFIETDQDKIPTLVHHMKKYRLRNNVHFDDENVNKAYNLWSLIATNPENQKTLGLWLTNTTCNLDANFYPDPRWPLAYRLITPFDRPAPEIMPKNNTVYNDTDGNLYTWLRTINGLSEGGQEIIHDSSIPLETNFDIFNGISFDKGCYLGQELVARTFHSGLVRKRHYPFITVGKVKDIKDLENPAYSKILRSTSSSIIPEGFLNEEGELDDNIINLKNVPPPKGAPIVPIERSEETETLVATNPKRKSEVVNSIFNASIVMTRMQELDDYQDTNGLYVFDVAGEKTVLKTIQPMWYEDVPAQDNPGVATRVNDIEDVCEGDPGIYMLDINDRIYLAEGEEKDPDIVLETSPVETVEKEDDLDTEEPLAEDKTHEEFRFYDIDPYEIYEVSPTEVEENLEENEESPAALDEVDDEAIDMEIDDLVAQYNESNPVDLIVEKCFDDRREQWKSEVRKALGEEKEEAEEIVNYEIDEEGGFEDFDEIPEENPTKYGKDFFSDVEERSSKKTFRK